MNALPRNLSRLAGSRTRLFSPPVFLLAALVAALITPHGARSSASQDDEVVRVEAELVLLNVTVTDASGSFVRKIPRKDFSVLEDGVRQTINIFALEENPFAAAILLDTSGSMEGRLTLARAAAVRFLDGLRTEDVASVYHFGTKVEQLKDFSGGRDLPSTAFDLRARGVTRLHDAVARAAQDLSRRPETRRAILVISDGADTGSSASLDKSLNAALSANATIYTVNMNDPGIPSTQRQILAATLKKYSEKSGGRYVSSPGGSALAEALEGILDELKNQYTVGYRPSNRARDGRWRTIEVSVAREGLQVRTRAGYNAPKKD